MKKQEGVFDAKQIVMLAVLLSGAALSVLNQTSVTPMLPVIKDELDVSSSLVQWLVSGFSLVSAVVIPVTAYMMTRFKTRNIFFASMGMFIVGSLICAVAPNFVFLLIGRILQAACAGVMMPLATNVMLLVFPIEKRGFALGIYSLITSLMPAIGPAVAGGLTDTLGWRSVYIIMLALGAAITLFAVFSLRNYGETNPVSLDVPSVILSALGLVALLYGISATSDEGLTPLTCGMIVAGIIIIAIFVVRQNRIETPVLKMEVFKHRRFTVGLAIIMIIMFAANGPAIVVPLLVQEGLGQSATVTGLMSIPTAIVGAIAALAAGRLFDRFGGRPLAITGSLIMALSFVAAAFMMEPYGVVWIVVCNMFWNLGMMSTCTPLNTWALGFLPDELIPHGNAMSTTLRQVSMSISIALFATLLAVASSGDASVSAQQAMVFGSRITFFLEAALCVIALILILVFVKPGQEAEFDSATEKEGERIHARDFMRIHLPVLKEDATLREAMELFIREGTTDSPVVNEKGNLVAFLSSSDIMRQLVSHNVLAPDLGGWSEIGDNSKLRDRLDQIIDCSVMTLATKNVVCVQANDSIEQICRVLSQKRFKKVPVLDGENLVGTINRDDVIGHIMKMLTRASSS